MAKGSKIAELAVVLGMAAMAISGCGPSKNTPIRRGYHNLTSHYNVYFNGREAWNEGMRVINDAHEDNFSLILPVFTYSDKEDALKAFSNMSRVIEKGEKCIRKHSITAKPKKKKGKQTAKDKAFQEKIEYVKWIDDAEMLIGKAQMIKQEHYAAIEAFTSIVRTFDDEKTKKEAYIWLARCYTELGKFVEAQDFMIRVTSDGNEVPRKLRSSYNATQADIYLRQQRYAEAIPFMEDAVATTRKKQDKVRYMYILAQLYQQNDDNIKAEQMFSKVIKTSPDYTYVFNAQINKAGLYNAETGNSESLQRELKRMLKDEKNIDYCDQIYYALGNIAYNEMRDDDALYFYKKSVEANTINTTQKSISYLAVAEVSFEKPDYTTAQKYYDSALVDLPREYPNYKSIKNKSDNLNYLIECINTIQTQDSLQKVARMSEYDRNALIQKKINEVKQAEQAEKNREQRRLSDIAETQATNRQNQTSGAWYFYNQASLSAGQSEFKKRWGNRKLEDNWRRSNKTVVEWTENNEHETESENNRPTDNTQPEYYLADLPLTDSAMRASEKKLEEATYNLGVIYKDKFEDFDLATTSFNSFLDKYPKSEYVPAALYNLYKIYLLNKDYTNAEKCKQQLITEHPDSDYARILSDPEYYRDIDRIERQLNFMYMATYRYFLTDSCAKVNYNYAYVDSAYPNSKLLPKFALLNTLCQGKNADTVTFKGLLQQYINRFPNSEEKSYAQDVIDALNRKPRVVEVKTEEQLIAEAEQAAQAAYDSLDVSMYNYDAAAEHYYMVVALAGKVEDARIKFNLIDFNAEYFDFLNFNITSQKTSDEFSVIMVEKFRNMKMARNYYESVVVAGEVFADITTDSYKHYIISAENLTKFLEDKNLLRYDKFFKLNYKVEP